jgi:hypothetical protein
VLGCCVARLPARCRLSALPTSARLSSRVCGLVLSTVLSTVHGRHSDCLQACISLVLPSAAVACRAVPQQQIAMSRPAHAVEPLVSRRVCLRRAPLFGLAYVSHCAGAVPCVQSYYSPCCNVFGKCIAQTRACAGLVAVATAACFLPRLSVLASRHVCAACTCRRLHPQAQHAPMLPVRRALDARCSVSSCCEWRCARVCVCVRVCGGGHSNAAAAMQCVPDHMRRMPFGCVCTVSYRARCVVRGVCHCWRPHPAASAGCAPVYCWRRLPTACVQPPNVTHTPTRVSVCPVCLLLVHRVQLVAGHQVLAAL